VAEYERLANSDADPKDPMALVEPPVAPRPPDDTAAILAAPDALHRAARVGRPDLVGRLLRAGANPNARDRYGFAPLHWVGFAQRPSEPFVPALETDFVAVIDTLLAHGADVNARAVRGEAMGMTTSGDAFVGATALSLAAAECADLPVAHLVRAGARPDETEAGGRTALIGAAMHGCDEMVRALIGIGATIDAQPNGGGTPLERLVSVSAFHEGHFACAKLLVEAGARREVARDRLAARLKDPGQGGFGFSNRPMARRVLQLLR
jgi:ankyrin repeat protein